MSNTKILLAEDDENLGALLKQYLNAKGYQTDWYTDGESAYKYFMLNIYDLCVLDVMMPVRDGFTLARDIRANNSNIPIVFLTAKALKEDIIEGFKIGADDYITKPFSMEELLFRIEAILRRTAKPESDISIFNIGMYAFDSTKQQLTLDDKTQKLTTKESELLKYLCIYKNRILERNYALRKIWQDDNYFNARCMDVYITKLRKFLSQDPSIQIINIHGKGFRLIAQ